jgi:hypothetical protein
MKGLELLLIVGVVAWFYVSQMSNLKKLKDAREAKSDSDPKKPDDPSTSA